MYYQSRYNFIWDKLDEYFMYNTLSNSFLKIDKNLYQLFKANEEVVNTESMPQDLIDYLRNSYFLLLNKEDDINKLKKNFIISRYKSQTLNLTIAPTTDCNFKCPYCYEEGIKAKSMDLDTLHMVCEYIKESKEKNVRIDWYGGEPLLEFDKILRICNHVKSAGKNLAIGMVTNGFLLTKDKVDLLVKFNFTNIQITIDGVGDTHESTRMHKENKPTFNKTIENIDYLLNNTNVFCNIRVNVSKNQNEYQNVFKFFENKFQGLNYNVYPAFVRDYSGIKPTFNINSCNQGMSFKEKAELFRKNYQFENGLKYPHLKRNDCACRGLNSYVIAPNGDFYKCWEDIHDKDLAIFNIHNRDVVKENLLNKYLFTADVLSDNKCLNCNILPICAGGYPASRIRKHEDRRFVHDCDVYKNNVEEFLSYYYENIV